MRIKGWGDSVTQSNLWVSKLKWLVLVKVLLSIHQVNGLKGATLCSVPLKLKTNDISSCSKWFLLVGTHKSNTFKSKTIKIILGFCSPCGLTRSLYFWNPRTRDGYVSNKSLWNHRKHVVFNHTHPWKISGLQSSVQSLFKEVA